MRTDFKPEIRQELESIVEVIVSTVNAVEVYLFGSFARGKETKDSDFDIFVVFDDTEERILRCCQRIHVALLPLNQRGFDILGEHYSKFYSDRSDDQLKYTIFQEGVKLYERSQVLA